MASVTQKIPNYIVGMSEQPDELKLPGQTTDLLNCVPDVVNQVVKRPGSRFVQNVENEVGAEWFNYYRDEQEQYIGCIRQNGLVRIWDAVNGNEETVTQTAATQAYLTHTAPEQLQPLTISDITYITNRQQFPRMTAATTAAPIPEGYVEVKVLAYAREYKFTIIMEGGQEIEISTTTATSPTTLISIDDILTATGAWEDQLQAAGFTTQVCGNGIYFTRNTFSVTVTTPGTGYTTANGVATTGGGSGADDLTLNITAAAGAITEATVNNAGTDYSAGDVLTVVQAGGSNGTVTLNGPFFNLTILDTQTMNGFTDSVTDFSRLPYQGFGGHRVRVSNTEDAEEDDFWVEFTPDQGTFGEGVWNEILQPSSQTTIDPTTMPHAIVRNATGDFTVQPIDWGQREAGVVNTTQVTIQGTTYTIEDPTRTTNPLPSFINELPANVNVGFNRKPISKLLLFRNRLVFLSNENVVLSQAGSFVSLFADSTIVLSPQDPIDITAASQKPALLFDGVEQNNGLVLFGETQQYLLSSDDSTVGLTQDTVKLGTIGYYLYDKEVRPVNMGTSVGFANMGGRSFRFFEMADITIEGEPNVTEISKTVSQLLPNGLTQIADSQEGSQLFFATDDTDRNNEVWGFRYYTVADKRYQQAWHRWLLPGQVIFHCIMRDTYYAVVRINNQNKILEFDIKLTDETKYYGDYRIHLDNMLDITESFIGGSVITPGQPEVYPGTQTDTVFPIPLNNGAAQITEITLPTVAYLAQSWFVPADGDAPVQQDVGLFKRITYQTANGVLYGIINDVTFLFRNNITNPTLAGQSNPFLNGGSFTVGYLFDMEVQIPKFYKVESDPTAGTVVKSDTRASLIIHRFTLDAGATGTFDCTLKRLGYADYVETFEANKMDTYRSNTPNLSDQVTRNISCYCRNTNLDVVLSSQHPSPFTLYSIAWEGDYTNKFYRSV